MYSYLVLILYIVHLLFHAVGVAVTSIATSILITIPMKIRRIQRTTLVLRKPKMIRPCLLPVYRSLTLRLNSARLQNEIDHGLFQFLMFRTQKRNLCYFEKNSSVLLRLRLISIHRAFYSSRAIQKLERWIGMLASISKNCIANFLFCEEIDIRGRSMEF